MERLAPCLGSGVRRGWGMATGRVLVPGWRKASDASLDVIEWVGQPGLSVAQAAEVLGVHPGTVAKMVSQGRLTKACKHQRQGLDLRDVEELALERWRRPGHPYWVTTREAAEILGVSATRVRQLVRRDLLPSVERQGRLFFRRPQVQVVANARQARWRPDGRHG